MQIFSHKSIDNNTLFVFFKNFRQNPCTSQSYSIPLPSLEYSCGALRINKGRGYMFKPDQNIY